MNITKLNINGIAILLFFFLLTQSAIGMSTEHVDLILVWDQDSHTYSDVGVDTGTINCLYNTCAALKYYPELRMTFNIPQSIMRELESFITRTDTFTVISDRINRIKELISTYKSFQYDGRLEISMMALYKPILPLVYNSQLVRKSMPGIDFPEEEFSFSQDVRALIFKGMAFYKKHLGRYPAGLFPSGGGVSHEVAEIVSETGLKWVIAAESQLAKAIGNRKILDDGIDNLINPSLEPEDRFKPYFMTDENIALFFSNNELSLGVADTDGRSGAKAADWLIKQVYSIGRKWKAAGIPVVTVILDSDKIWHDANEGERFVSRLYGRLSSGKRIRTVTPSEWLDDYLNELDEEVGIPEADRLNELAPDTWYDSGFEAWIGDNEENKAWSYLARTRKALEVYKDSGRAEMEKLDRAFRNIYAAESGDWFWWYGDDHDSGDDAGYDRLFRFLLIDTYKYIGEEPPSEFYLPITSRITVPGVREITGLLAPEIDGFVSEEEWDNAGCYINFNEGGVFDKLYYGYGRYHLYLRLDTRLDLTVREESDLFIAFYIGTPGAEVNNVYTRFGERSFKKSLKFGLSNEVAIQFDKSEKAILYSAIGDNEWQPVTGIYSMKFSENVVEISVPLRYLKVSSGDEIMVSAVAARDQKEFDVIPQPGPVGIKLEEIVTVSEIIRADDPLNDSRGPGWFTYPESPLFSQEHFDLQSFAVKKELDSIIFEVKLRQLENTLESPAGLGPQIIDIYIDLNNQHGSGSTELLEGRNAYTLETDAWEWAITINGWRQELYKTGPSEEPVKVADLKTEVVNNTIRIRVPDKLIKGNPENWGFIPVIFAQDCSGYSEGVIPEKDIGRICPINAKQGEYSFGGGIEGVTDTNVLDVILPKGKNQSGILKVYKKGNAVQLPAIRK